MHKKIEEIIGLVASIITIIQVYFLHESEVMYYEFLNNSFLLLPIMFILFKWACHTCIKCVAAGFAVINSINGKIELNKVLYFIIRSVLFALWLVLWYLGYGIFLRHVLTAVVNNRIRFIEVSVWFVCMLIIGCRQEILFLFRNKNIIQQLNEAVVFYTAMYVIYFASTTLHIFFK